MELVGNLIEFFIRYRNQTRNVNDTKNIKDLKKFEEVKTVTKISTRSESTETSEKVTFDLIKPGTRDFPNIQRHTGFFNTKAIKQFKINKKQFPKDNNKY